MNERIQELARQSGGIDMTNYVAGGITTWVGTGTPEFIEKFAELIVRECANAAYQSLYEDRIFDDSPHIIRTKVMDDIKKHFGFEE